MTLALSSAQKWAVLLGNPYVIRDPETRGQNQKWLNHPSLLGRPKGGGTVRQPLRSRGSPGKRDMIKSGYITLAFSGAQKWAVLLCDPCVLGDPHKRAQN